MEIEMNLTKRQLELLMVLNPFRGDTSYQDAADELGISRQAVQRMMGRIKIRCPKIYTAFEKLRKNLSNGVQDINNPTVLDPKNFDYLKLKKVF